MSINTLSLNISPDAWIQTFGGFFGGLLAGGIAIYLFKRQVNLELKRSRVNELQNFLKSYYVLNEWFVRILSTTERLAEIMETDTYSIHDRMEILPYNIESLNTSIYQLNQINDDYIPQDIYKAYLEMKSLITFFKKQCEIDLNRYQEGHLNEPFKGTYRTNYNLLNLYKEEIERYAKNNEEELKKHMK
ncbi:hypothetical protein [Paenibacillus glacialis]|uniref:Uncharacterized protein n=1 Tax=Paenibacillus glacialis TaxID=494026 RepID=A0A168DF43_9BACL|nr:hypothetical protein [Paenibacillus glacialis]OAB34139.1 hypothetical protein PGLA_24910 [Paenibacillus glacialis]